MNILLIYPEYPDTFWSFKHVLRFISKKAAFPPLGLLTLASMLPEDWNKKLIDANTNDLDDKDILWADLVFISGMLVQKASAQDIIRRCKTLGRTVVAGGPLFTTHQEKFEGVDHFVLYLEDLKNGIPKPIYTSTERPDVTKTPVPLWNLVDLKNYAAMAVQYSRGCPFNCDFCDIIVMNGRIPRTKKPEQLTNELQSLYDVGWRGSVFIVDDNFIGNKTNVKQMLPYLIKWQKERNYPFKFFTEASTNLADDNELMQMMSLANFHKVFLGIETPNVESLKECGKLQNVKRNITDTVRIIHQNGMQVMGGFIVGFDSDTESIFETQIKFIQEIGVVTAMVGLLNALPQTRLWYRLKAEGRLVSDTSGENTDGTINFIPKIGKEKLVDGYKKILSTIYSPKQYYKRIEEFVKYYKPTVRSRISAEDLRAFMRSIWIIGILSKSRLLYWKLIMKTIFTKTKAFPIAVELAIFGIHFDRICSRVVRT